MGDVTLEQIPESPAAPLHGGEQELSLPSQTGARLFQSFFQAGFECSSHRRRDGTRLDLIAATHHDLFAREDYRRLRKFGLRTARDGIRWHLIEAQAGGHDFSSALPAIRAARETGTQVIWDVCHYGWPDWLDVFSPQFVSRLAALAAAFVRLLLDEGEGVPYIVPVNEISFVSWSGGTEGHFPPFARGRAAELKQQYVRASVAAIEAIWAVAPQARICHIDPLCNVVPMSDDPEDVAAARGYHNAQFEAWDMIAGRLHPELGGKPEYLDVIGVNYYVHNQWMRSRDGSWTEMIPPSDAAYRPLYELLAGVDRRYQRPLFIAETGIEDELRPKWLRYVCSQVREAQRLGVPVHGICLYPIVDYPGWADGRHCCAGLWGYPNRRGQRRLDLPLARELRDQQLWFEPRYQHLHPAAGGIG